MMLGSSCSPCCGQDDCTADLQYEIHEKISSSEASVTLSGNFPRWDAAAFLSPASKSRETVCGGVNSDANRDTLKQSLNVVSATPDMTGRHDLALIAAPIPSPWDWHVEFYKELSSSILLYIRFANYPLGGSSQPSFVWKRPGKTGGCPVWFRLDLQLRHRLWSLVSQSYFPSSIAIATLSASSSSGRQYSADVVQAPHYFNFGGYNCSGLQIAGDPFNFGVALHAYWQTDFGLGQSALASPGSVYVLADAAWTPQEINPTFSQNGFSFSGQPTSFSVIPSWNNARPRRWRQNTGSVADNRWVTGMTQQGNVQPFSVNVPVTVSQSALQYTASESDQFDLTNILVELTQ